MPLLLIVERRKIKDKRVGTIAGTFQIVRSAYLHYLPSLPLRGVALVTQFGWQGKPPYICGPVGHTGDGKGAHFLFQLRIKSVGSDFLSLLGLYRKTHFAPGYLIPEVSLPGTE